MNRRIAPHVIRMAETRAVARAFRMAVNIGAVAVEELLDDVVDEPKNDNGIAHVEAPRPEPTFASPSPSPLTRGFASPKSSGFDGVT